MKRLITATCVSIAFSVGGSAAQTANGQMPKDMMKDGQKTMAGCVAAGNSAGKFMLTNAMMMGDMMGKPMTDADRMKMSSDHMMSYELVGGDLRAHMGHKVEVTGTMSKMDMDTMAKMDKMDKMAKDKMMADKSMQAMKLNVTSVKMVSATCP